MKYILNLLTTDYIIVDFFMRVQKYAIDIISILLALLLQNPVYLIFHVNLNDFKLSLYHIRD